ncbi:MAG TPA: HNH endonuclease signature motif containing protein [Blastocatellia bacterium]|nr:HNH endonuclease signature motif containing protein [Blastocatellia bacterium]
MSSYISEDLRHLVAHRADYLCEYCPVHEDDTFFGCQVDHIISLKHGGSTEPDNLAYACVFCNRYKGSDIASIATTSGSLVRFFNPRIDRWSDHFRLKGSMIEPLTEVGEATARILRFNSVERTLEREALIEVDRYPTEAAVMRMQ